MSLLSILKTIGNDIEIGISAAGPIIGAFIPAAGPILTDIAEVIAELESIGSNPTTSQTSSAIQVLAHASAIKQAAKAGQIGT